MSRPFVIWCGQRTSSISLFNALSAVSEHPAAESEPFDGHVEHRQFDDVLGHPDRDERLTAICRQGWLIKHVFEYLPPDFNLALAHIASAAGYRHIRLDRADALARLISLGVAEQIATWFPCPNTDRSLAAVAQGRRKLRPLPVESLVRRQRDYEATWKSLSAQIPHVHVWTEECVSPQVAVRHAALERLLKHIDIPVRRLEEVDEVLLRGGQDTARVHHTIPNLGELRRALV